MMAPLAQHDTVISIKGDLVSKPYIDITLALMHTFGVNVENENYQTFRIAGGQGYVSPGDYLVEGMHRLRLISLPPPQLKVAQFA